MPIDLNAYRGLSSAIFSAALDAGQWTSVLEQASRIVPGANLHVFGYNSTGEPLVSCSLGYDPHWARLFEEYYGAINPWGEGIVSQPVGQVRPAEAMCPDEKLRKTEFYADWVRPQNDIRRGGGGVIGRSNRAVAMVGANIEAHRGERVERDWLDLVRLMMPLLRQSWDVGLELAAGALEREIMNLGAGPSPSIVLVGDDARIRFANAHGRADLARGSLFRQDPAGRLTLAAPIAQRAFETLTARLAAQLTPLALDIWKDGAPGRLRMIPFDPDHLTEWGMGAYLGLQGPSLVLVASPRVRPPPDPVQTLVAGYGLTPAEAEVARLLADGLSLREIAGMRGTAYGTVQTQVKMIADKLGVRRQVEIVMAVRGIGRR